MRVTTDTHGSGNIKQLAMLSSVILCTVCVLLGTPCAVAQPVACTQQVIDQLETEAGAVRSWSALHSFFHRYTKCDGEDAEVETAVGGFVTRTLVNHWESLPRAAKRFKQDPAFENFALAGINITELTEDLDRIDNLATNRCPSELHLLCAKIRKAVRENK